MVADAQEMVLSAGQKRSGVNGTEPTKGLLFLRVVNEVKEGWRGPSPGVPVIS